MDINYCKLDNLSRFIKQYYRNLVIFASVNVNRRLRTDIKMAVAV